MQNRRIRITCESSGLMTLDELENFQGELKSIDAESFKKLKMSIEKYGFSFPIFVWGGSILDGHQRLAAVRSLVAEGWELDGGRLPVVLIEAKDRKEAAEKLLLINSRYAEIEQTGFDQFVENYGIDFDDIADLIEIPEIDLSLPDELFEGNTDPDDVPEVEETPVSKEGDIWILGDHRLMCGDSRKVENVERLMGGEKADLCFTSPPYAMNEKIIGKKQKDSNRKIYLEYNDNIVDFYDLISSADKFCDYSAINLQLNADNRQNFIKYLNDIGSKLIDIMVWYKHTTAPNFHPSILSRGYEFLIIYGRKDAKTVHIPLSDWHGTINNVIDIDSRRWAEYRDIHKATMPVEFAKYTIGEVFNLADKILEPFSGTGTTIIAAEQTNRRCFAMEISPQYVDVAVKRWQDFTGEKAVLESTGETFEEVI